MSASNVVALNAPRHGPRELDAPFFAYLKESKIVRDDAGMTTDPEEAVRLVEWHRRLSCPHYEDCLEHAATRAWANFSCLGCAR